MTTQAETLKVIGIDTKSFGIHWVSSFPLGTGDETYGWANCTFKDDDPRRQADLRRQQIFDYAHGMAAWVPSGTHVYCEEPLALQNGATTRLLGLAAGAVWAAFHVNPVCHWHWVDVAAWKKLVLGRGNPPKDWSPEPKSTRTKRWIEECVRNNALFQFQSNPVMLEDFSKQSDLFDAWAIKRYGMLKEST